MPSRVELRFQGWRNGMAIALASTFLLAAPAATANSYDRVGEASWYGKRYHGRTTANGERFDMNALTAAHKHLPFGTMVRVTNLNNKRSLVVRINDRGPYVRGRIIDLSRRAAALLDFQIDGITKVRVQTVRAAPKKRPRRQVRRTLRIAGSPHEESVRRSLARSHMYQPVTLRPPAGTGW